MAPRLFLVGVLICAATFALGLPTQATKRHLPQSLPVLPTFTDVTKASGINFKNEACHTSQKYFIETMEGGVALFDYDGDGFLDLVVARYVEWDFSLNPWCGEHKPGYRSYCHPDNFKPISSLLYHNNGDGTFIDVSEKAGFSGAAGKGLGIAFNDLDRDGWPDIVVANDEFPQQLFKNNRDGTFTEAAKLQGLAFDEDGRTYAGMGIDLQDYDNDGWPDVFINALSNQKYALYRNTREGFEYVSG